MSYLRSSLMVASLGLALAGCSSSSTSGSGNSNASSNAQKSPDQQVADIALQFESLTAAEKAGAKGQKLMDDLKAIKGELSEKAVEAAARLASKHNLAKLGEQLHKYNDKTGERGRFPPGEGGPDLGKFDPANPPGNFKLPDRGKLPTAPAFPPFDPGKLAPDGKFPIDPTKIFPDGKFPLDPGKFLPDGKFPIDPGKLIPDGKFPDFPKIPDLKLPPAPKIPDQPK